ncbi:hypothetical protein QAD02_011927 [Eretmocerus hayati]|uniref:Uncharacterized protein n=1 Tax=Eretmocerus hayati TaxID=131215 RepID=A0ACC2NZA6_9HYME|nr:hypothetical protein QAD02_011927 [Eretmocerus hayati]
MRGFILALITFKLMILRGNAILKLESDVPIAEYDSSWRKLGNLDQTLKIAEISTAKIQKQGRFSDQSSYSRDRRAINGSMVDDHAYRFIVSLHKGRTNAHTCAGTILSSKLILTAAHCIKNKTSRPTHIRVSNGDGVHITMVGIKDYIYHEQSDIKRSINDIGLLVLKNSIPNPEIVKLAPKNLTLIHGTMVVAYGWGRTAENGTISENLRSVELPISHPQDCSINYGLSKSRICVETQKASTCNGDSGGPLMWKNYQIGVISAHKNSCMSGLPSVSTYLPAFTEWIYEKIRSLQEQELI